jgi:TfoX/Sxy family transcriptional regulator of competence genes
LPTFRKSPPELVNRFDELAELVPEANQRLMFGYPSCVLRGNMFMSLYEDSLVLRLAEADRTRLLAEPDASPFEPMPGRPMREYVVVPPALVSDPAIDDWVALSYAYAQQLPVKKPKAAKKT